MFCHLFLNTTFALLAIPLIIWYFYVRYSIYSYWQRRGVPHVKPSFPFGNFRKNFMQKLSIGEQIDELYRSTTAPFIGAYALFRPVLIPRDPSLIRAMLTKDFQHFTDRGVHNDEENEPLTGMLFSTTGDKWKNLRTKLTPTFTSGKMRAIFNTIVDCQRPLEKYITEAARTGKIIEANETCACYTTNVIASVAFGIDINCLDDPNIPFRLYGRKYFEVSLKNNIRQILFAISPKWLTWSGLRMTDRDVEEFFISLTEKTLELREKHNIVRKDFFQLLVQLRNTGTVQLDDEWKTVIANDNNKTLTLNEMAAQTFVVYLAGFESGSSTMAYFLLEIAKNLEIQQKVHEEIDRVLAQHNGELTYDSLNDLKYLECCIDETLRKYVIFQFLNRICTKDYKIPGSNVTIEKGTGILIPCFSVHRDEQFYLDPLKFDPSRFDSENKKGKTPLDMPYLPFGDGPRNCIGQRLGKMSVKIGLVSILQKHCVEIDDRHIGKELDFSKGSFLLTPESGVHCKFKPRQRSA